MDGGPRDLGKLDSGDHSEDRRHTRSISIAQQTNMQHQRVNIQKKRRHAIDQAQQAHIAAAAAREQVRRDAEIVKSAWDSLPPLHNARRFITAEQSESVIRIMCVLYENMGGDPRWFPRAVHHASRGTGISEVMVREIWSKFSANGEFYETDRPLPPKSDDDKRWDSAACEFLDHELPRAATLGIAHSAKSLQPLLKSELGHNFSLYRIRRLLDGLDYTWRHLKQDWSVGMKSARRQRQLFIHLILFDQALAEVRAGTAVILFTDQTFIDTRTHFRFGYFNADKTHFLFPKGTGERVGHMHALSAHGLLAVNAEDGTPLHGPSTDEVRGQRATEVALTADLTFSLHRKTGSPEPDAKPGFSAKVCADWVQNRFIPAARKVWPPSIRLYLYMDNYSGHTGRDSAHFWPRAGKGHTRRWNLEGLKAAGCVSLTHKGTVYAIDMLLSSSAPKGGPLARDIISLGRDWMWSNHPESALSAVENAALTDPNLQIIFSVPLTPDANPIEHWWGTAKGLLGRLYDHDYRPATITKRWQDITMAQGMTMGGVSAAHSNLKVNPRCQAYVDSGIAYTQAVLVPVSPMRDCGTLGSFDLSDLDGALELRRAMSADRRVYYKLWRETEGLSLVAAPGADTDDDTDESDSDDELA